MKIVIHEAAAADIETIFEWISRDRPKAAAELIRRVRMRINRLARPGAAHIGRPGLVAGTRELIEGPYIIVYAVDEPSNQITVLQSSTAQEIGRPNRHSRRPCCLVPSGFLFR